MTTREALITTITRILDSIRYGSSLSNHQLAENFIDALNNYLNEEHGDTTYIAKDGTITGKPPITKGRPELIMDRGTTYTSEDGRPDTRTKPMVISYLADPKKSRLTSIAGMATELTIPYRRWDECQASICWSKGQLAWNKAQLRCNECIWFVPGTM